MTAIAWQYELSARRACLLCLQSPLRSVRQVRSQHTQAGGEPPRHQVSQDDVEASSSGSSGATWSSSAASHLFAEAEAQENRAAEDVATRLSNRILEASRKDTPWTGDESVEDAVLRMLMDKYKPLRVPGTKRQIQQPSTEPFYIPPKAIITVNEQVDQSAPSYKWKEGDPPRWPWEHSFRTPAERTGGMPAVRAGHHVSAPIMPPKTVGGSTTHNRAKRASPGEIAARVYRAKDASFDYATGERDTAKAKVAAVRPGQSERRRNHPSGVGGAPTPASIRGWNALVDERIELARQQGVFNNLKGRGKPIAKDEDESNPFITRSEFLMNRIVKRQEAAPPFVELQKEMRDDLQSFRARLRAAWIRRATRMISLQPITPSVIADCGDFRDPEWEAREEGYHERTVAELNNLIRRYNIVAPASVRANLTTLEAELKACYRDCEGLIREELQRRVKMGLEPPVQHKLKLGKEDGPKGKTAEEEAAVRETMLSAFRRLVKEVFAKKQ